MRQAATAALLAPLLVLAVSPARITLSSRSATAGRSARPPAPPSCRAPTASTTTATASPTASIPTAPARRAAASPATSAWPAAACVRAICRSCRRSTGIRVTIRQRHRAGRLRADGGRARLPHLSVPERRDDVLVGAAGELTISERHLPLRRRHAARQARGRSGVGLRVFAGDGDRDARRQPGRLPAQGRGRRARLRVPDAGARDGSRCIALADPNGTGGFFNADYLPPMTNDYSAADYVVGTAARDQLLAAGYRDDGIAFYVSDAGTRARLPQVVRRRLAARGRPCSSSTARRRRRAPTMPPRR